ncbi:MAG: hypothetical protein H3C54_02895 [Taibaiella sp.]|nr:hypothetical protein [Taibaiella sp.]
MKSFVILLCFLSLSDYVSAQSIDLKLVGHCRTEYYVLKGDGYYVVEHLSPLKYGEAIYDTLFPTHNHTDTFRGRKYSLYRKDGNIRLANNRYKHGVLKIKDIDEEARTARESIHNHFVSSPYEPQMAELARKLMTKKRTEDYSKFNRDREHIYDLSRSIGTEKFKDSFRVFIEKYNLNK